MRIHILFTSNLKQWANTQIPYMMTLHGDKYKGCHVDTVNDHYAIGSKCCGYFNQDDDVGPDNGHDLQYDILG